MTEKRECPVCGNCNAVECSEERSHHYLYGPDVTTIDRYLDCPDCQEQAQLGNDWEEKAEEHRQKMAVEILDWFNTEVGYNDATLWRRAQLGSKTIKQWRAGHVSESDFVLLCLLRKFPWLVTAIDKNFDEGVCAWLERIHVDEHNLSDTLKRCEELWPPKKGESGWDEGEALIAKIHAFEVEHVHIKPPTAEAAAQFRREQEGKSTTPALKDDTVDMKLPHADTEEEARKLAHEGFNAWLASLPKDDWGEGAFDDWIPVHWDEEKQEWVEEKRDG